MAKKKNRKKQHKTNEIVNQARDEKSDINITVGSEFATRDNALDGTIDFGALPNPDPILKEMGKDIEVYNDLKFDNRVKSVTLSRKSAVKRMEWQVVGEDTPQAEIDFYDSFFKEFYNIRHTMGEILDAFLFGYKPMEIVWGEFESKIMPMKFVGKPQEWFIYDEDNNLRFLSKDDPTNGILVPDNKFIVPSVEADYDNPYGVPALSGCFWPVTFRKNGWGWWSVFVEKYGMPFLHGKVPANTPDAVRKKLLEDMDQAIQDSCLVTEDNQTIETIERKSNDGASDSMHKTYIEQADKEITMIILGHSAGADSTPGKLGNENLALEVREDIIDDDKTLVEDTFNELIKLTHSFNFNTPAPKFSLTKKEKGDKGRSERDKNIMDADPRFQPTEQYYAETYGLEAGADFTLDGVKNNEPTGKEKTDKTDS